MVETEKRKSEAEAPLVTFALFAYNQEQYIREAIEGAFSQDYENLEIILSDDCSTDNTFKIMEECAATYSGPHRVGVRQNLQNIGVAAHFDTLMREARGDLVVIAAGDDVSAPTRARKMVDAYIESKNVTVIESVCENFNLNASAGPFDLRDGSSIEFNLKDFFSKKHPTFIGAGRCYVRDAYVQFPPLMPGCPEEDTPALLRALYCGVGLYLDIALVKRRIHDQNLSSAASLMKMDFGELKKQYIQDLDAAVKLGIVGLVDYKKYFQLIHSYISGKQLRVEFYSGFKMELGFWAIVKSRSLGLRDKFSYIKKWLIGRFY